MSNPVNPLTEVKVNGMDTVPLEGMVTLVAEIVKLGVGADGCASQRLEESARRTARQVRTLFLVITETSWRSSQQPYGGMVLLHEDTLSNPSTAWRGG
jgi:hypothetical protein